jgi:hypothetical protein
MAQTEDGLFRCGACFHYLRPVFIPSSQASAASPDRGSHPHRNLFHQSTPPLTVTYAQTHPTHPVLSSQKERLTNLLSTVFHAGQHVSHYGDTGLPEPVNG